MTLKIKHKGGERTSCAEKLPDILFKACVKSTAANFPRDAGGTNPETNPSLRFEYDRMFYRRQNCKIFDFTNQVCKTDKCFDGYYLVNNRCCANDEFPFNDGCIKKTSILANCASYD